MRRSISILVAVALAAGVAHAAPKKRTVAQALSGAGAGVSSVLVLSAFLAPGDGTVNDPLFYTGAISSVVTPSLGEFYAGTYLTWGMGLRAASAAVAGYALATYKDDIRCGNEAGKTCKELSSTGVYVVGIAAVFYIGGVALDVLDAGDAVDRWNEKHGYTVTPIVVPGPPGSAWRTSAFGLGLAGRW